MPHSSLVVSALLFYLFLATSTSVDAVGVPDIVINLPNAFVAEEKKQYEALPIPSIPAEQVKLMRESGELPDESVAPDMTADPILVESEEPSPGIEEPSAEPTVEVIETTEPSPEGTETHSKGGDDDMDDGEEKDKTATIDPIVPINPPVEEPKDDPPVVHPSAAPCATDNAHSGSGDDIEIPSEEPSPDIAITFEPTLSIEPSEDPIFTPEPSDGPIISPEPTDELVPSEEPSEEPIPSEEPSEEPIPSPEPVENPVETVLPPAPTVSPATTTDRGMPSLLPCPSIIPEPILVSRAPVPSPSESPMPPPPTPAPSSSTPPMAPKPTSTKAPEPAIDICQAAYDYCMFTIGGSHEVPVYDLPATPDVAFTEKIEFKRKEMKKYGSVGVMNSGKFVPQFIIHNTAKEITEFGLVPTAVKTVTLVSGMGSGITHEALEANKVALLKDRCIRIFFHSYQIEGGNVNLDRKLDRACVVFKTSAVHRY